MQSHLRFESFQIVSKWGIRAKIDDGSLFGKALNGFRVLNEKGHLMLISEMIKRLEEVKAEKGDLQVGFLHDDVEEEGMINLETQFTVEAAKFDTEDSDVPGGEVYCMIACPEDLEAIQDEDGEEGEEDEEEEDEEEEAPAKLK